MHSVIIFFDRKKLKSTEGIKIIKNFFNCEKYACTRKCSFCGVTSQPQKFIYSMGVIIIPGEGGIFLFTKDPQPLVTVLLKICKNARYFYQRVQKFFSGGPKSLKIYRALEVEDCTFISIFSCFFCF